ncbi:MAG: Ppx/GppA phosphatase family protein [Alphaproteobacteria bacterium]
MASRRARNAQNETRQRRDGRWQHVYAALDLGTNNCRLLVAKPNRDGFRVVDAFSRIVRLGEGLGNSSILSEQAMDRAIEALRVCQSKVESNGVTRLRAVATEACRRADNGVAFIERARAETNIELEVIAPDEEAELALIGCSPLYDAPRGENAYALLFDIGGGSTQITWLKLHHASAVPGQVDTEIIDCISVPCGVVTLSERFGYGEGADGRASPKLYGQICEHVRELLVAFDAQHHISRLVAGGAVQMVGTSGTVTTLTGVHLGLPRYNRDRVDGRHLDFAELGSARDHLLGLDRQDRAAHPCIGPERADLVVSGCAVLDAICGLWPVGRLRVADRGLREGILHGLMRSADREAAQAGA